MSGSVAGEDDLLPTWEGVPKGALSRRLVGSVAACQNAGGALWNRQFRELGS